MLPGGSLQVASAACSRARAGAPAAPSRKSTKLSAKPAAVVAPLLAAAATVPSPLLVAADAAKRAPAMRSARMATKRPHCCRPPPRQAAKIGCVAPGTSTQGGAAVAALAGATSSGHCRRLVATMPGETLTRSVSQGPLAPPTASRLGHSSSCTLTDRYSSAGLPAPAHCLTVLRGLT